MLMRLSYKRKSENKEKDCHMKSQNEKGHPDGTRNVYRTLSIIREVYRLQNNKGTLSNISKSLELPISTVKRILSVLTMEGFVNFSSDTKSYYLGYELYRMIRESMPIMIKEKYHIALQKIADITGDTSYLTIRSDLNSLCIDEAKGGCSIGISYGIGTLTPLGLIASGITLLSQMEDEKIIEVMEKNKIHYEKYQTTPEKIWHDINTVKEFGYIRCESIIIEGLMNVAVPISDKDGGLNCSIVVSSTGARMTSKRCEQIVQIINEQVNQ